jgi:hypothetical protein
MSGVDRNSQNYMQGGQLVSINARITEDQKSIFTWHRTVRKSIDFVHYCSARSNTTTDAFRRRMQNARIIAIKGCPYYGLYNNGDNWVNGMFEMLGESSIKMKPMEFFDKYVCIEYNDFYTMRNAMFQWEQQFQYVTNTDYFRYVMLGDSDMAGSSSRLNLFLQSIQVIFRFVQEKFAGIKKLPMFQPDASPTRTASDHFSGSESDATDED